jgi:hypothetical protein
LLLGHSVRYWGSFISQYLFDIDAENIALIQSISVDRSLPQQVERHGFENIAADTQILIGDTPDRDSIYHRIGPLCASGCPSDAQDQ